MKFWEFQFTLMVKITPTFVDVDLKFCNEM